MKKIFTLVLLVMACLVSGIHTQAQEVAQLPEGIAMEDGWAFTCPDAGRFVSMGFDGNDVYMVGFSNLFPEVPIKGYLTDDGQCVFPTGQYLGYYSYYDMDFYMVGANYDWDNIQDIVMDYDTETKCLSSAVPQTMFENVYTDEIYYYTFYDNPMVRYQTEADQNAAPTNPSYNGYVEYYDEYNWTMPICKVNGYLLDRTRMYYNVYVNGELYTFYWDDYGFLDMNTGDPIEEDFEDMPYSGIYTYYLYWYTGNNLGITFMSEGEEVMGVQVFFKGFDGVLYSSDLVTVNLTDGIKEALAQKSEVTSEEYYTISGLKVTNPRDGLYIKRTISADGSVTARKVSIR